MINKIIFQGKKTEVVPMSISSRDKGETCGIIQFKGITGKILSLTVENSASGEENSFVTAKNGDEDFVVTSDCLVPLLLGNYFIRVTSDAELPSDAEIIVK